VHFTTPDLESLGSSMKELSGTYLESQAVLVTKTVDTALTYLPVVEAASALVGELDTLAAFATTAALSAGSYVRPTVLPRGQGVVNIKAARHPCVELMDRVEFIANDYNLVRGESSFQIITGPNMVRKTTPRVASSLRHQHIYFDPRCSIGYPTHHLSHVICL
jgi:DNA mismatch repair protein MSH2